MEEKRDLSNRDGAGKFEVSKGILPPPLHHECVRLCVSHYFFNFFSYGVEQSSVEIIRKEAILESMGDIIT